MAANYAPPKYSLDISRPGHTPKKFKCPQCNQKRFVKFIDYQTGYYLEDKFGRCDRHEHCGYFLSPYANQEKKPFTPGNFTPPPQKLPEIKIVPRPTVAATLRLYDANNLATFFLSALGQAHTRNIIARYWVGTAKGNATIFWQIDSTMRARTGARILYDPETGKRDKITSVTRLFTKGDGYEPCLFGEHLLFTESDKCAVAIVESEKTACIASAYLPTLNGIPVIWLACSGENGLTDEKIKAIAGKHVILCPDFSFSARATWGFVKMRKSTNNYNRSVPDPKGEIQEDFIPVSKRLRDRGCTVDFFDPAPEISDSSDLADLLLSTGPPPPFILPPDFSALRLAVQPKIENGPQSNGNGANPAFNGSGLGSTAPAQLSGKSFRIDRELNSGRFRAISDGVQAAEIATEFINRDPVRELIESCGIKMGGFETLEAVEAYYTAAEMRREQAMERPIEKVTVRIKCR